MIEYIWALLYIVLGLIGGAFHWVKKRYIDLTTEDSFWRYLVENSKHTRQATYAIICAEVALSLVHTGTGITLSELIGALTAGYMADSTLNKATPTGV